MAGTALTLPDGSTQVFDNDKLPEAVAAGAAPPQSVRITLPNGAESEVPWDTYVRMSRAQPGITLTPEDTIQGERHLADLEDDTSAVGAFGRGALEQLSFGAYKPDDDQALADSHYHGTAHGIGSFAGAVGPLLLPGLGEAGLVARGAEAGESLLSAGRAAAELLPGRVAGQLGARVYEAAGGGLKGVLAGGAAEGAGADILRSVLDRDHKLSGESILDSAGMYAAGAGVGYGLARAGSAASEAFGRLSNRIERGAGRVDDAELVERLESNRPPTEAQRGTPDALHGRDVLGNVQTDLPLYSANRALVRDAGSMLRQVEAWRSSPLGRVAPELEPVLDRGVQSLRVVKNFADLEPAVQAKAMGAYEGHLHDIDEMAAAIARQPGGLDVASVTGRWRPENVAARQEAISKIDPGSLSPAQFAAQRLAARLTTGVGRIAEAAPVADGLLSRIPVVGKVLNRAVQGHPLASLLVLDRAMEHGVLHAAGSVAPVAAAAKLAQKAFEVPGRGIGLSGLAAESLSKLGVHGDLPEERHARAAEVARRISAMTPDDATRMASQAAAHIAPVSPDALAATGAAAANRQNVLRGRVQEIFPPRQSAIQMDSRPPTSAQVRDLDRTLQVASDPTAFVRLLAQGRLSNRDLQLARGMWPAHVDRATRLASAWLGERQGDVPRATARRLETLLGPAAVGSVHDDSARAAQASIQSARARLKPQAGPSPSPSKSEPRTDLMSPAGLAASGHRP